MFFDSSLFWLLLGMVTVLVGVGFKAFAEDRGWQLTWWKWVLSIVWYGITMVSFFAAGTLVGENEASAAWRILALGLFVSLILAVGLWRLWSYEPEAA
jgi:type VI protein secretion system component VasK